MARNCRLSLSLNGCVALLVIAYPTPAQEQDAADALTNERTLTRDYLRFRFRSGTAQPEWITVLSKEVSDLESGEKGKAHPGPLAARFAAAWGAKSEQALSDWVEENTTLHQELCALPAPAGPPSLPAEYSISGRVPTESPDSWTLLRVKRMLAAAAVTTPDNRVRRECFQVMDNISRMLAAGAHSVELRTALGVEELKWMVLYYGLFDDPSSFRSIVLESPDIITKKDLAATVREHDRRFVMCIVADTKHGGLVDSPLAPGQLKSLNQLNLDLAHRLESLRSLGELVEFKNGIQDPILNRIVEDELLWIRSLATQVLYLDDFRTVTRTIARFGIDRAAQVETKYFQLERKADTLIARNGDRSFKLWPPPDGVGIGFSQLVPNVDKGNSTHPEE